MALRVNVLLLAAGEFEAVRLPAKAHLDPALDPRYLGRARPVVPLHQDGAGVGSESDASLLPVDLHAPSGAHPLPGQRVEATTVLKLEGPGAGEPPRPPGPPWVRSEERRVG